MTTDKRKDCEYGDNNGDNKLWCYMSCIGVNGDCCNCAKFKQKEITK